MRFVPNALSLSRIPLAVVLFFFAMNERWGWAAAIMIVALITDALDGAVARRYDVVSDFGGKILETYCDLALAIGAVGGLYAGGYWPLWVPIVLLTTHVLLELSHRTPYVQLKRHTFYLHPLFFIAVVVVACYALLSAAYGDSGQFFAIGLLYAMAWGMVGTRKQERLMYWIRGPQFIPSS